MINKLCTSSHNFATSHIFFFTLQCYLFHMYVGVRAGGGIGDEIEDPAGDEYELYRVVFDITFFFFVIVILLAIIQGTENPLLGDIYQILHYSSNVIIV